MCLSGFLRGCVFRWVAEDLSRMFVKRLILKYLESGVGVGDVEKAMKEFEETRSEVWRELEEKYRREGLI